MDNCLPNQERRENTILTVAADVKAEKRPFLRSPDFPLGEISVIAGAGGIGKGQFGCYVMMCLSTGIDYRTGIKVYEPCNSLFISTEDTASDIRARLDRAAVNGDLSRIFIVDKLKSYEMGLFKFYTTLGNIRLEDKHYGKSK